MQEQVGVIALGVFVGFLLGTGLATTKPSLKAALTVLSAALGGAPVAFLGSADHRWLYPIGLVFGFLWVRGISLWRTIAASTTNVGHPPSQRRASILELAVITIVTIGGVAYGLSSRPTVLEQTGEIRNTAVGAHEVKVHYPRPFARPPELTLPPTFSGSEDYSAVDQQAEGFVLRIGTGTSLGATIKWKAVGEAAR